MKCILAIIRNEMYQDTKNELNKIHHSAFNTREVLGKGKQNVAFVMAKGNERYEYSSSLTISKRMMEFFVRDDDVEIVIQTILKINCHHHHGDGKIFVLPADDCIRIHTRETGEAALI